MRKRLGCAVLAALLMMGSGYAAEPSPAAEAPVRWIEGSYRYAEPFSEGLAVIGYWDDDWGGYRMGAVDQAGRVAIPCRWHELGSFHEGLAYAGGNGESLRYVDKTGETVIDPPFDYATDFSEGLAYAGRAGSTFFLRPDGETAMSFTGLTVHGKGFSEGLCAAARGAWGYIDPAGKLAIPYQFEEAEDFSEGLAAVKQGDKWGYIDRTGAVVVEPRFAYAGDFHEGRAAVWESNESCGYIDRTGKLAVPFVNDYFVWDFSEGLAAVMRDDRYGYIDPQGGTVIPFGFGAAGEFHEGLAVVGHTVDEGESWEYGYIDRTGALVLPYQFRDATDFADGYAMVIELTADDRYGRAGVLKNPLRAKTASDWAAPAIERARAAGLLDAESDSYYTYPITRRAFAGLAVRLTEHLTGEALPAAPTGRFSDTDDEGVRRAAQAGIVSGLSETEFGPEDFLTREQLSAMLYRALRAAGAAPPESPEALAAFADASAVSDWARGPAGALAACGVLRGTSADTLSPGDVVTGEQAVVLALRAYER